MEIYQIWWIPQNHGEDGEECSISAVPRKKIIHLSLDPGGFKPCEAIAKHCLSWSCFPSSLALGSKPSSTVGSEHKIPGPSVAVMFPLSCSPPSPAFCLPLPRAAGLPRGRSLAHGSCNPPDPSRRASSATAHLFPKHVL